jgi:hypothetical protein
MDHLTVSIMSALHAVHACGSREALLLELADNVEDEAYDDADDNACGERKIKGEIFFPDNDITRQFPEKRHLLQKQHDDADDNENNTEDDNGSCQLIHRQTFFNNRNCSGGQAQPVFRMEPRRIREFYPGRRASPSAG